ncbi:MAG: LysR substrate-binding domain-containing protein [Enterovibrio sp.]
MKIQQFKYLVAIKAHNFNISAAAQALFSTQPGVSKQVALLEQELGVKIFKRRGKSLIGLTAIGEQLLVQSERVLDVEQTIKELVAKYLDPNAGTLNIYTTHTIARYLLPQAVAHFVRKYPDIHFHLHPTLPLQCGNVISKGQFDLSIVAHDVRQDHDLLALPAYLWTLALVVPKEHPLAKCKRPTLQQLAHYPILSYESGATGRVTQDRAFAAAGLAPSYFMTVMDAEVIKRYVQLGFGIGIIASVAAKELDPETLLCIELDHLFSPSPAWICFAKDLLLQSYMYDFLESFSPHLTKDRLEKLMQQPSQENVARLFCDVKLPVY